MATRSNLRDLNRSLRAATLEPRHAATVTLARTYAAMLDDDPSSAWRIGPKYLATLVELGLTPKPWPRMGRPPASERVSDDPRRAVLDELRARRGRQAREA